MKEKKDDRLSIAATVVFNTIRSYVKTKHAQSISAVQTRPCFQAGSKVDSPRLRVRP